MCCKKKNSVMQFTIEDLPYEVLYHFVSNFVSIPNMCKLKNLNSFFNSLVKDIIDNRKYNSDFLQIQTILIKHERKCAVNKSNALKCETHFIEEQIKELEVKKEQLISKRQNLKKYRSQLRVLMKNLEMFTFGPPNVWMVAKTGFHRLRDAAPFPFVLNYSLETYDVNSMLHYNLDHVLTKLPKKRWMWIGTKNDESKLENVDSRLKEEGWIKFFPLKKEKDIAFLYVHPEEPHVDILNRSKFYDCPICKSSLHTMYYCKNAQCYKCHKRGHITRMCSKFISNK